MSEYWNEMTFTETGRSLILLKDLPLNPGVTLTIHMGGTNRDLCTAECDGSFNTLENVRAEAQCLKVIPPDHQEVDGRDQTMEDISDKEHTTVQIASLLIRAIMKINCQSIFYDPLKRSICRWRGEGGGPWPFQPYAVGGFIRSLIINIHHGAHVINGLEDLYVHVFHWEPDKWISSGSLMFLNWTRKRDVYPPPLPLLNSKQPSGSLCHPFLTNRNKALRPLL